jgi:photosystem II stability/assembly factor-like uncharacterized protein
LAGCRLAGVGPTALSDDYIEPSAAQSGATPSITAEDGAEVLNAELQADGSGWLLNAGGQLFATLDGGQSWQQLTPPIKPQVVATHGHRLLASEIVGTPGEDLTMKYEVAIALSEDYGSTWATSRVEVAGQPGRLDADLRTDQAVVLVQQTTGVNFSVADILVSDDGINWVTHPAPISGDVAVLARDEVWIAGGATGGELSRSANLGADWTQVDLPRAETETHGVGLPAVVGQDQREAILTVNGEQSKLVRIRSSDEGRTWSVAEETSISASTVAGVAFDAQYADKAWHILTPDGVLVRFAGEDSSSGPADGLLGVVSAYSIADGGLGLALVTSIGCSSEDTCSADQSLMRSSDGGRTWTVIDLPH